MPLFTLKYREFSPKRDLTYAKMNKATYSKVGRLIKALIRETETPDNLEALLKVDRRYGKHRDTNQYQTHYAILIGLFSKYECAGDFSTRQLDHLNYLLESIGIEQIELEPVLSEFEQRPLNEFFNA